MGETAWFAEVRQACGSQAIDSGGRGAWGEGQRRASGGGRRTNARTAAGMCTWPGGRAVGGRAVCPELRASVRRRGSRSSGMSGGHDRAARALLGHSTRGRLSFTLRPRQARPGGRLPDGQRSRRGCAGDRASQRRRRGVHQRSALLLSRRPRVSDRHFPSEPDRTRTHRTSSLGHRTDRPSAVRGGTLVSGELAAEINDRRPPRKSPFGDGRSRVDDRCSTIAGRRPRTPWLDGGSLDG